MYDGLVLLGCYTTLLGDWRPVLWDRLYSHIQGFNVYFVFIGCFLYFMSQNLIMICVFFPFTNMTIFIHFILHTPLYFLKISHMLVLVCVYVLWSMFLFLSYKFKFRSNYFNVCMSWKWSGTEIVITVQVVKCVAWNFLVVIFHYVVNQVSHVYYIFVVCGALCIVFVTV